MDNTKDDNYYVHKIIENLKFALNNTKNVSLEDFSENEVLVNAILFSFIQISENASKLSLDYKGKINYVAWNEIRGIRNKIVHDYDIIEVKTIFDTVINDFPPMLDSLEKESTINVLFYSVNMFLMAFVTSLIIKS